MWFTEGMSDTTTKTIHLALQGGGAHGAFTWGVRAAALQGQVNGFGGGITHAFSEPQADEKF